MGRAHRILIDARRARADLERADDSLETIRARYGLGSPVLSWAPGGCGGRDLSAYAAQAEQIVRERDMAAGHYERARQAALDVLRGCRNDQARQMLTLIYIDGIPEADAYRQCGRKYTSGWITCRREIERLDRLLPAPADHG